MVTQSEKALREQAWLGDAVLALYARRWILSNERKFGGESVRTELFKRMTSNQFLASIGKPTEIEAELGRVYENEGLENAFAWLDEKVLPLYLKQLRNWKRGGTK